MAVHVSLPRRMAADLAHNPASCQVGDVTCPPPSMVLEAVVPIAYSDTGRLSWLTCDQLACLCEAQQLADSYAPVETDLRFATVAELAELSGMDVTGAYDEAGAA